MLHSLCRWSSGFRTGRLSKAYPGATLRLCFSSFPKQAQKPKQHSQDGILSMDVNGTQTLKLGLAVGHGTGPELADVFERVITHLAKGTRVDVQFNRSSRVYHSYSSLLSTDKSKSEKTHEIIADETMQDAMHYKSFCEEQALQGTCAIFRTAITAESLYLVRQCLEAVKVECFSQAGNSDPRSSARLLYRY